jgi:hypothetical protein
LADQVAGQAGGYENFVEDDFFEYDNPGSPTTSYGTGIHDWYGPYPGICAYGYRAGQTGYCDIINAGQGTPYDNFITGKAGFPATDWTQFHTIGHLWVPGSAANGFQGYVENFIDGAPANAGTGAFSPLSKVGWTWRH